jgi:hypothetical protein
MSPAVLHARRARRLLVLLAAVLAVGLATLAVLGVQAAPAPGAQNATRVFNPATHALAGGRTTGLPSSRPDPSGPATGIAVGCCVATEDAGGAEGVLRHYTTEQGARGIQADGEIAPGAESGRVYLTPDQYGSALEAQQQLALKESPFGYFEVPFSRVPGVAGPATVEPKYGQPGGGNECFVSCPVNARGLPFRRIGP